MDDLRHIGIISKWSNVGMISKWSNVSAVAGNPPRAPRTQSLQALQVRVPTHPATLSARIGSFGHRAGYAHRYRNSEGRRHCDCLADAASNWRPSSAWATTQAPSWAAYSLKMHINSWQLAVFDAECSWGLAHGDSMICCNAAHAQGSRQIWQPALPLATWLRCSHGCMCTIVHNPWLLVIDLILR